MEFATEARGLSPSEVEWVRQAILATVAHQVPAGFEEDKDLKACVPAGKMCNQVCSSDFHHPLMTGELHVDVMFCLFVAWRSRSWTSTSRCWAGLPWVSSAPSRISETHPNHSLITH